MATSSLLLLGSISQAFPLIPNLRSDINHIMTSNGVLNRVTPKDVALEIKDPVDPTALQQARAILDELLTGNGEGSSSSSSGQVGGEALLTVAKRLGDVPPDATKFLVSKEECQKAYEGLTDAERTALTNIYGRIKAFAEMQRKSVVDVEMDIPGGKAGHTVSPCRGEFLYLSSWKYRGNLIAVFLQISQCDVWNFIDTP